MWIKLELETIATENLALHVDLGNKPTVLPAVLQKAGPELQEAWKTFHAAVDGRGNPPATLERLKQPWIRVQESWPSFYGVITDLLLNTSTNTTTQLTIFK